VAQPVTLDTEDGLGIMRISREHGNAINRDLAEGLSGAIREAEASDRLRGLLFAASGKLFSPGLDLQELIELDRGGMRAFLNSFNGAFLDLFSFSKPMVAAIHGHAIAGGFLMTLAADWRILKQGAQVGLAEIKVGVPFPYAIALILQEAVPRSCLAEVALLGRNYIDSEALETGLVHELCEAGSFEEDCRRRLAELAAKDPKAYAVSKRYLRSRTIDRIRAAGGRHDDEWLDAWFSPATQERIKDLVEGLGVRTDS
jgi:enoyl-CoA hydratase